MTTVFFATNRNPNRRKNPTNFGPGFSSDGFDNLRFGWAEVPGDTIKDIKITVAPENMDTAEPKDQVLGSIETFKRIHAKMAKQACDTMFFIHGFDFTFKEAILRTAQLKRWYAKKPMNWIVFTWPSDGTKLPPFKAYHDDRKDAAASGMAMARGVLKAADYVRTIPRHDFCRQRTHLMAHSMGGYALRHTVQGMRRFAGDALARLIDEIILMAVDTDNDGLEKPDKLAPLERLGRRVTSYYNMQDLALVVSDWTKMNPDRLGASGARRVEDLPPKFVQVNCSPAIDWDEDPTGHQYYRNNPTVRDDVLAVLAGKEDSDIPGRKYRSEGRYYRLG